MVQALWRQQCNDPTHNILFLHFVSTHLSCIESRTSSVPLHSPKSTALPPPFLAPALSRLIWKTEIVLSLLIVKETSG